MPGVTSAGEVLASNLTDLGEPMASCLFPIDTPADSARESHGHSPSAVGVFRPGLDNIMH